MVSKRKWPERAQGNFTPFFGVVTFTFAVIMLLFTAVAGVRFSMGSLVTITALVLWLVATGLSFGFAARPALVRRLGLALGVAGTLLVLPFVVGGLVAVGQGPLPEPRTLTALAAIGLVCGLYAVLAAVALRQELRYREHPESVPA
jgi:hypothetical protein